MLNEVAVTGPELALFNFLTQTLTNKTIFLLHICWFDYGISSFSGLSFFIVLIFIDLIHFFSWHRASCICLPPSFIWCIKEKKFFLTFCLFHFLKKKKKKAVSSLIFRSFISLFFPFFFSPRETLGLNVNTRNRMRV